MAVKFSGFTSSSLNSTGFIVGYDSATNSNIRISKSTLDTTYQATLISTTNIKTINGNSILGSGDLVVGGSSSLAVGTTPITSGTVGRILFEGTGNILQESANLFWDNTNGRLGINNSSPSAKIDVLGTGTTSATSTFISRRGFDGEINASIKDDGTWFLGSANYRLSATGGQFDFSTPYGVIASINQSQTFFRTPQAGSVSFELVSNFKLLGANVLIGTTTDAGFKLDVNGTARVQGNTTVTGFLSLNSFLTLTPAINGNVIQGTQTIEYRSGGSSASRNYHWFTNANAFTSTVDEMYHVLMTATFAPTSGTAGYNQLTIYPVINQTGGANGVTRGLLIQPTLTAAANWRAIEISSGGVYVNTTSVAASSILQADSTTQGFLPPRMTNAQRLAIASPAVGLIVYCTDVVEGLYINKSTGWTFVI